MRTVIILPLLLLVGNGIAAAQSRGEFTPTGSMNVPRVWHTATLLTNGKVLITGGIDARYPRVVTASSELYDPLTRTFTRTGDMISPRVLHTATLLPDGTVLVTGATNAELYDPATGTFRSLGDIGDSVAAKNVAPCNTATLLNSGKALIAVGVWWPGPKALGIPAVVYDPIAAQFTPAGLSVTTHSYEYTCPSATLLADGRVLMAWEDPDAEVYRPDDGSFAPAGDMVVRDGYQDYTATLLNNGMVLIAGATDSGVIRSAELYDPIAGRFISTGNLNKPRAAHTSTLLPDGMVLLTGGRGPNSTPFDDAELYDAGSRTFSATGKMLAARFGHTATLLADGTVLLAGGASSPDGDLVLASAELYHSASLVPAPALLSKSGDQQGAILHAGTARLVTADDPAVPGEALEIYATGLKGGSVIPPQVSIGGRLAEILYFGEAPGFEGLNQVNVRVPEGVVSASAVPVRLTYLGRPSNTVTIGVR